MDEGVIVIFKVTVSLFVVGILAYILYIFVKVAVGIYLPALDISTELDIIGIIIACVLLASGLWASVWLSLKIIREKETQG